MQLKIQIFHIHHCLLVCTAVHCLYLVGKYVPASVPRRLLSSLVSSVQMFDILSDILDVMTLASCWLMVGFFPCISHLAPLELTWNSFGEG